LHLLEREKTRERTLTISNTIDPHPNRQLTFQGYSVLLTQRDGMIVEGLGLGLFDYDTRILSKYRLLIDDEAPRCDTGANVESDSWVAHLTLSRPGKSAVGPRLPQDAIAIELRRRVGNGMAEQIILRNYSMAPVDVTLRLEFGADFADISEKDGTPSHGGTTTSTQDADALTFEHHASRRGQRLHRAVRIRVLHSDSHATGGADALTFPVRLAPGGVWRAALVFESLVDEIWRSPQGGACVGATDRDRIRNVWRGARTRVEALHPVLAPAFDQAAEDLLALRAWEIDDASDAWVVNAGVPTYTGLFGRDSLTAAWQGALVSSEMLRGTLARLAATQATDDSAWHDREPGKMVHEMRRGPLSDLDIIPQRAYYGTQTASAMFVVALTEYWHWTGDTAALERYRDAALRTFEWAERFGDRDGDGFLEYERRSARGLKNHGWKDSDEAIRYPDGRLVDNPIATVEEQAYHWIALQRMAEILTALADNDGADRFAAKARNLRVRWHEAFWMPDEQFYAMALGPDKQPVRSIGSNPGHALAAGLVPQEHARACADRLMADDLFSGWGVRTLSHQHPSYNPLAYHLGTVWPVENATFALGFKRYGLDDHLDRLATGMCDAAAHFRNFRLPETIGGLGPRESPVPSVYPNSNSPQAWSASAMVQLVQALLGLYPFAPAQILAVIRPRLPEWLPVVTVRHLRIGDATVSIRFERGRDGSTSFEVIEKSGTLFVMEVPPPQDINRRGESFLEATKMWLVDRAPGRLAAALRLALGEDEQIS
jgi:glycogen debranching enzyme